MVLRKDKLDSFWDKCRSVSRSERVKLKKLIKENVRKGEKHGKMYVLGFYSGLNCDFSFSTKLWFSF